MSKHLILFIFIIGCLYLSVGLSVENAECAERSSESSGSVSKPDSSGSAQGSEKDMKNGAATPYENIYGEIESLKLERDGYRLGAKLTSAQKELSMENRIPSAAEGTLRFRDGNLFIVVESSTDRVAIIFETFENVSSRRVQDIVGDLMISFKEPTLSAHDRLIYWAYGPAGKYSPDEFESTKNSGKGIDIIATVKLQSELPITGGTGQNATGKVYYIISSEKLLKKFR